VIGPNSDLCQGSIDSQNWVTKDVIALVDASTMGGDGGAMIGCHMSHCCISCGVTGTPWNSWLVGIVSENIKQRR